MSDVQTIGGYVTAGSLFALGLASWQVLIALLAGSAIVSALCNLVAKPSQSAGVPYPVICRSAFGVRGANIPAVIRGLIAVPWFGIQTYLASAALDVVLLKLFPGLLPYAAMDRYGFLGLPMLGWGSFLLLWALQICVFWRGMAAIRGFISFCGPAVSVVMVLLCGYLISKAGWGAIDLDLGGVTRTGAQSIPAMCGAIALVVSYFAGPMLNFGDFSRYAKSFATVRRGNLWGLPINFVVFSVLAVITTSLTVPLFGELISDPVSMVARTDNVFAIVLSACTLVVATIGINIVANFVSPAFDFSNVAPQHISWRTGGMIAAASSVVITPWNLYNNPTVIHYTLEVLGALIGPLFGVLVTDHYLVRRQKLVVDDLFTLDRRGSYWYRRGYNRVALTAVVVGGVPAVLSVAVDVHGVAQYSWFIGCGIAALTHHVFSGRRVAATTGGDPVAR